MREQYEALKELVTSLEENFAKFIDKENSSAGTRLRKGLQEVRKSAQALRVAIGDAKKSRKATAQDSVSGPVSE